MSNHMSGGNVNTSVNVNEEVRKLVVKSAVRMVPLDEIHTDASYQREVKRKHLLIVNAFDPNAFGIPLVAQREDGSLWVVDGLQRITALRKMGKRDVRAEVFASNGPEHEAQVFKIVNMQRTRLTIAEEFKALLTAHDELAWEIKEAVESVGYTLCLKPKKSGGRPGALDSSTLTEVGCLSTLLTVAQAHGVEPIKFALRIVRKAWPADGQGTHNLTIGGLCHFHVRREGIVDEERLILRLQVVPVQKVLSVAAQMAIGTGNRFGHVADVLERYYARRVNPRRGQTL